MIMIYNLSYYLFLCLFVSQLFNMVDANKDIFDVREFCLNPSADLLENANLGKDDWKYIATNFGIQYNSSHTKAELRNIVIASLVGSEYLPESALGFEPLNDHSTSENFESVLAAASVEPNLEETNRLTQEELDKQKEKRRWERESFTLVSKHRQLSREFELEKQLKLAREEHKLALERKREESRLALETKKQELLLNLEYEKEKAKIQEAQNSLRLSSS